MGHDTVSLKTEAECSLGTSQGHYPVTRHHIPGIPSPRFQLSLNNENNFYGFQ